MRATYVLATWTVMLDRVVWKNRGVNVGIETGLVFVAAVKADFKNRDDVDCMVWVGARKKEEGMRGAGPAANK